MRGRFVPVLVSSLFVLSVLAGCIGGGGAGDAKTNAEGKVGGTPEPPPDETTGAIEGIVADAAFNLFIGALVAITTDGAKILKNVTTDDSGQYYAGGLAPGEYKVFATYTDHKPQGKSVIVVAGEASSLNFVLEPLPRVEPRIDEHIPLSYYIECGAGFAGSSNQASVACGEQNPNSNQNTQEEFHADRGLTTMVITAEWNPAAPVGARDGKVWLYFELVAPSGVRLDFWYDDPPETHKRWDFNLTEETQDFLYGEDGNWTLTVLPSSGNNSRQYDQNAGVVGQLRIDAWVTLAYDNYYVPPEFTGFPDE